MINTEGKIRCERHPEYDPEQGDPPKGSGCCTCWDLWDQIWRFRKVPEFKLNFPVDMFQKSYPEFHEKGWGYELWLVNNADYCGKILHFNAGKRCSFHYHKLKHEHFYVIKGMFDIKLAETDEQIYNLKAQEKRLYTGEVLKIPPLLRHQMIALPESEIIEISTHHFESDSYRVVKGD